MTLTVGGECSITNLCNIRIGGTVYSYTRPLYDLTVTAGEGPAFIYAERNGLVVVGTSALTLTCSSPTSRVCEPPGVIRTGITAFPANALPLWTWTAGPVPPVGIPDGTPQPSVWAEIGVDARAYLSRE